MATSNGIPGLDPTAAPIPARGERFVSRDPASGAATLNAAFIGALDQLAENALTLRRDWLTKLGDQRRDVDDECGYPKGPVTLTELVKMYDEEPVAARVVECMPKESWQVAPSVYEDEDEANVTAFEQAWDDLGKALAANGGQSWHQDEQGSPVWDYLQRADILSRIGAFGVLFMGFDDGLDLSVPVPGSVELPPGVEPPEAVQDEEKPDALKGPRPRRRSRRPARRDSPTTNEELAALKALDKLTTREGLVINYLECQAREHSDLVGNRIADPRSLADGSYYTQLGAEAQYFGVQAGPTEVPGAKPAGKGLSLLFLRAFSEDLVQVVRYEGDVTNPRFGQPVMYRVTFNDPRTHSTGVGLPLATMFVHWSRVIHLADVGHHARSSEIFAAPAQQPVYTRLLDLRKTSGAAGEGYFRGGTPGLILETPPQLGGEVIVDDKSLKDQAELFQNGFQKILRLTALTAKIVAPTVADPTPFCAAFIEQICIKLAIPVRVFKGSERGELASSQDDASWNDRVRHRQNTYLTPRVICPFVDRLILVGVLPEPDFVPEPKEVPADALDLPPSAAELEAGKAAPGEGTEGGAAPAAGEGKPPAKALPKKVVPGRVPGKSPVPTANATPPAPTPKMDQPADDDPSTPSPGETDAKAEGEASEVTRPVGYRVHWPDLDSNSEKDKADIAKVRVEAIAAYVSGGVDAMIPPLDFLTKIMQFDVLEAKEMMAAADAAAKQAQEQAAALAEEHGLVPEVEGFRDPDAPPPDMLPGMGHPDDDPDMAANAAGRLAWLESLVASELEHQALNQFCPTGPGGGVDPKCGSGGSGAKPKTHTVRLPKNPKRLNIDTMALALDQMGYKVGGMRVDAKRPGGTSPDNFVTSYEVTAPDGTKKRLTAKEVRGVVYGGRAPTANAFCPTGPGGGVDPSCSPGSSSPAPAPHEDWQHSPGPKGSQRRWLNVHTGQARYADARPTGRTAAQKAADEADRTRRLADPAAFNPHSTAAKQAADWEAANGLAPGSTLKLVGNMPGSAVTVMPLNSSMMVSVNHPDTTSWHRSVQVEPGGEATVYNSMFFLRPSRGGTGYGTDVFTSQVRGAVDAGVTKLKTTAGRGTLSGAPMNGYSTWPRLGYDAPLTTHQRRKLPPDLKASRTVLDLYQTKAGRDWWKEHGATTSMTFDVSPNSRSMKTLNDYLASKGKPGVEFPAGRWEQTRLDIQARANKLDPERLEREARGRQFSRAYRVLDQAGMTAGADRRYMMGTEYDAMERLTRAPSDPHGRATREDMMQRAWDGVLRDRANARFRDRMREHFDNRAAVQDILDRAMAEHNLSPSEMFARARGLGHTRDDVLWNPDPVAAVRSVYLTALAQAASMPGEG